MPDQPKNRSSRSVVEELGDLNRLDNEVVDREGNHQDCEIKVITKHGRKSFPSSVKSLHVDSTLITVGIIFKQIS